MDELNWNVVLVEQTESGQYRKEEIHKDGSVTGSFGWVDPNGVLRLTDYISDAGGYRIERERLFKVSFNHVTPHDCEPKLYLFQLLLIISFIPCSYNEQ